MESTKKVQGKRKRTRPPRGRRDGPAASTLIVIPLKSGAKQFSFVWKKAFPSGRWPAKWAWA